MSKSLARVRAALDRAGIAAEIREMAESTRTAEEAAAAVGCTPDQIVKSLVFTGAATGRLLLFLTAGGQRLDPSRAAAVAGEPLSRADPARVREETGFAIGGVAPLGHLSPPPAYFDVRLREFPVVWAAAGTPRHVFSVAPAALVRATGAEPADFSSPA